MARSSVDPLINERPAWNSLFDLMEEYSAKHPELTDDEVFNAVCFRVIPDRIAANIDAAKERRREQY